MRKRPGRHRARSFARAVDGSGAPPSSVAKLVSLANVLRGVPMRNPSPRGSVRERLMVEAATAQPVEHRSFWAEWLDRIRFQRGLASTTVLCTVLIAVAGIGFGTTESLPGDTLYSMKLRSESVQLAFIGSDAERGKKNLKFADSRLDEITRLVRHKGDWPTTHSAKASQKPSTDAVERLINRTFDTMDTSTAAGAKAMRKAFERTGDRSPLTYLDTFTRKQRAQLNDIIPKLPSGSRESASHSLAYVDELNKETAKILGCEDGATCGDDESSSAASNPTTEPGGPGSTSPSTSATSPTESGTTGTSTSAVPPPTNTSSEPTTGTGSSTTEDPTDSGSSTGTGSSSTGTSSSGSGSSSTTSPSPTESPSGSGSPSATPPEPTGVPSDPDDSSPTTKTGDGAVAEDTAASGDASRQTGESTEEESAVDQSADSDGDTEASATAEPTSP